MVQVEQARRGVPVADDRRRVARRRVISRRETTG